MRDYESYAPAFAVCKAPRGPVIYANSVATLPPKSRLAPTVAPIVAPMVVSVAAGIFWSVPAVRAATPPPAHFARAAVASDHEQASLAGVVALKSGGNAVDAACATALALGVVHPHASGIGGGGFALVYLAKDRRLIAFDFRERAPAAIRAELFLKDGKADARLSREGGLAVGVPGEVRGLAELVRRHGRLPFSRCVGPAEKLARGSEVSWRLAETWATVAKEAAPPSPPPEQGAAPSPSTSPSPSPSSGGTRDPVFARLFGAPVPAAGSTFRLPELAATLARLRMRGPDDFYKGAIADAIVKAVRDAGGVMTRADLESYTPVERQPVSVTYRGRRVISMAPPSSGGVALAELLGVLGARFTDAAELEKLGRGSSAHLHVLAEAMKHAFADRARHLGDPDFVKVPTERLLAPAYHRELAGRIREGAVLPSASYGTPDAPPAEHRDGGTAHLSVIDAEGNAVALTTTVNLSFGAKLVAGKTGIVLNNQMDDFSVQPGVPNGFGLIGSRMNAIEPGKRPLSSMSPTLVFDGDDVQIAVGAAGGPTIITATAQVLLNLVDWKMDAQAAMAAPRIHHQWFPEVLMVEPEIARDVLDGLARRGHKPQPIPRIGVSNLVVRTANGLDAAAEPRSPSAPAGY